jgi:uncharacterized protein
LRLNLSPMIFENQQIPVSELPHVEEIDFHPLHPAALKMRYWSNALTFALGFPAAMLFLPALWAPALWLIPLLTVIGFPFSIWVARRQFEREGYALRAHDIAHRQGVWWTEQTTVPFSRVQHVEISQGPIAKFFGLGALQVFTAGGSGGDLYISGIAMEEAQRLKAFIVSKTGSDDPA